MVFKVVFLTASALPLASASETMGRSRRDMEPVSAFGKNKSGSAIPVSTP